MFPFKIKKHAVFGFWEGHSRWYASVAEETGFFEILNWSSLPKDMFPRKLRWDEWPLYVLRLALVLPLLHDHDFDCLSRYLVRSNKLRFGVAAGVDQYCLVENCRIVWQGKLLPFRPSMLDCDSRWSKCHVVKRLSTVAGMFRLELKMGMHVSSNNIIIIFII